MDKFDNMGKEELRAACRTASISYGKLNNDGMRAALRAVEPSEFDKPVVAAPIAHPDEYYVQLADKMDLTKLDRTGIEGHCPCCGINLDNGWTDYESMCEHNKVEAGKMVYEFACLGCGGEFGPAVQHSKQAVNTGTGVKIEKDRESRNGITRPSAGGKCRAVWDALDAYLAETKEQPAVAHARAIAEDEGWNVSNTVIEFYQWRKFNGFTGRK